eukprot:11830125-Heterocapsa_arctica.AAC.1
MVFRCLPSSPLKLRITAQCLYGIWTVNRANSKRKAKPTPDSGIYPAQLPELGSRLELVFLYLQMRRE